MKNTKAYHFIVNIMTNHPRSFSVSVSTLLLLITLTISIRINNYSYEEDRRLAYLVGDAFSDRLELALSYALSATQSLAFTVEQEYDADSFDIIAQKIYDTYGVLSGVELAPNGIVRKVYPYEENKGAIGFNIISDSIQRHEAAIAIQKKRLIFAGPLNLVQGGVGVVGRLPIFITKGEKEEFWGFALVVIKLEKLLDFVDADEIGELGFVFQISRTDPSTTRTDTFYNNHLRFDKPVEVTITIPNGTWNLSIIPRDGWVVNSGVIPYAVTGVFLSFFVGLFMWYVGRQPERLSRLVLEKTSELQQSEELFRSVTESATDAIIIRDVHHRIFFWNPGAERMYGWSSKEVIGKDIRDLFYGDSAKHSEVIDQLFRDGSVSGEFSQFTRERKEIVADVRLNVIKDVEGKPKSILAINTDITEKKKYENHLLRSQRLESLGTLAGGIAHDFNNILGIILAHASLIDSGKLTHEKIISSIQKISESVHRGAALVRQILAFSRKANITFTPLSVRSLIHELVPMLRETFPKTITVRDEIDDTIPNIDADHSQIHQVLLNLCVNARDAMPKGGEIIISAVRAEKKDVIQRFSTAEKDHYICIAVSDNGSGMDEETKNQIFDPFFTTKEQGKGTGLGLSVVFGVIQNHKGHIHVDSKIGVGTTFRMYLPYISETIKVVEKNEKSAKNISTGSETILFVEDEELLRLAVQKILELKGYTVLCATDGVEAVDMFKKHIDEIDIVLTDMGLPNLSGEDEIREIINIKPTTTFLLASGYLEPKLKSELLNAGSISFIQKPYNMDEVLQAVRNALDLNK